MAVRVAPEDFSIELNENYYYANMRLGPGRYMIPIITEEYWKGYPDNRKHSLGIDKDCYISLKFDGNLMTVKQRISTFFESSGSVTYDLTDCTEEFKLRFQSNRK